MEQISDFFKKYKKFIKGNKELKETINSSLKELALPEIDPELIKIKGSVLYFSTNPVIKNEFFLRKQEILTLINQRQDQYRFSDIRF